MNITAPRPGACRRWALAALGLHVAFAAVLLLGPGQGDPAWFIHFGTRRIPVTLARQVLGPGVVVPHLDGHDGRFFWIQARDPLLLHPSLDAANFDRPAYRAQRVAYPALAAPGRIFGEYGIVWALLLSNLALVAVGTSVTVALALDVGAPARAGLAFAVSPVVIIATVFDTADVLATAAVITVVLLVRRRSWWPAVGAGVVATLAKEPAWLCLVGVAVLVPDVPRRMRAALIGIPGAAAGLWGLYVRLRLGWSGASVEEFTAPFAGYVDAYRRGWRPVGNWSDALVAVGVLAVAVWIFLRWWRNRSPLLAAAVPLALLVPLFSAQVLDLADNSLRVLGPAITLLALDVYATTLRAKPRPVPLVPPGPSTSRR